MDKEISYYKSNELYLQDIQELIKQKIDLYCTYAVHINQNGSIRHIFDTTTFQEELNNLTEINFSEENQKEYAVQLEQLEKYAKIIEQKASASIKQGIPIPLEYLFHIFQLSSFEKHCMMMAAAIELNREFDRCYGFLLDDLNSHYPTLDLCVKMYTLDSIKGKQLLIETVEREDIWKYLFIPISNEKRGHLSAPLKLQEHIADFMFSFRKVDKDVNRLTRNIIPDGKQIDVMRTSFADRITNIIKKRTQDENQLFYLYGQEGCGKKEILTQISNKTAVILMLVDMRGLLVSPDWETILFNICQEAYIKRAWLAFDQFDLYCKQEKEYPGKIQKFIEQVFQLSHIVFFLGEEKWHFQYNKENMNFFQILIPELSITERIYIWHHYLDQLNKEEDISAEALASKFIFTRGTIEKSIKEANNLALLEEDGKITNTILHQACRNQINHSLGKLASPILAKYQWDDLILPERQKDMLRQACGQIELKHIVYDEWDFNSKMAYGKGTSMLFYGPPGTGKTMGAQVMANRLQLEIYKVDMSAVMSKYIGETQKNLDVIFEEIKRSQSILFFDEADSLFGKRSEVHDSHDKYANADTSYLLQKIEEYEGIIILATNFMQNFDDAFKRRFKFMVEFPFPNLEQRYQIWKHVFPEKLPLNHDVDFMFMAETFEFSGANIKNIALAASFLAAGFQDQVSMKYLIKATQNEMTKLGKILAKDSLGIYQNLLSQT
ncbi:MAG: ATP-binding protein [Lachnospiraceae bacterium]